MNPAEALVTFGLCYLLSQVFGGRRVQWSDPLDARLEAAQKLKESN